MGSAAVTGGVPAQARSDFVRCRHAGFAQALQALLGDAKPRGRDEDSCHDARSNSDYPTILASIRERLLALPRETVVRLGDRADAAQ
jgi:hypothetical protein